MLGPPLSLRLPNAPPILAGRADDAVRIAQAIRRAPLTIVYGPGGIGKLAVVEHVIHRELSDALDRTIFVRGEPGDAMLEVVGRALARLHDTPAPSVLSLEAVLELAELKRTWIVIDGSHDEGWALCSIVAQYARHSRWIISTTQPPTDVVLEYAYSMGALAADALGELAREWHRDLDADERALAVVASRGSPQRLRRILAERISRGPGALIDGDPATERLLALLTATALPIPDRIVRNLAPELTQPAFDVLVDRGLVVIRDGAIVLHDVARQVLAGRRPTPVEARELAVQLADCREVPLVAEAIRIALEIRDTDLALQLLERDDGRLLARVEGHGLATRLLAVDDPRMSRWRLRAAVELGDGDVLPELVDGSVLAQDPTDRLMWAEALLRANRIDAALAAVAHVDQPEARLLAARGYSTRGELDRALAELARLSAMTGVADSVAVAATALAARLEALAGHASAARTALAKLRTRMSTLPETSQRDVLQSLAATHHDLGELAATTTLLDQLEQSLVADPLGRFVGRRARLVRTIVAVERGELAAAEASLADLERATSFASLHRPFLALIGAQLALARGDVRTADAMLASVDAPHAGLNYIGAWEVALAARIGLIDPAATVARALPSGAGMWPAVARIHSARLALRLGDAPAELTADLAIGGDDAAVEVWFAARAFAWERALLAGHASSALVLATETGRRCRELGFRVFEAEAVAGAIDAAVVVRDRAARDGAIERLASLGAAIGSDHFAAEAEFARVLATGAAPEHLELVATTSITPRTRRARSLLGDPAAGDRIDRLVTSVIGVSSPMLVAGPIGSWGSGWGIDRRRRAVWRPNGHLVPLSDKPQLWRILDALATTPTGLSKELLVVQAWGIPYHPLRHDKLLHNSIHKLRKLIEDEPAAPRRLPTTSDGYRIGDDTPVRVIG